LRSICNLLQRLRIACSVRPGSASAIKFHLCPSSPTAAMILASSVSLHCVRSALMRERSGAWLGASSLVSKLTPVSQSIASTSGPGPPASSSELEVSRCSSCSRFQRLRTASSVLPGSADAITRHRLPSSLTHRMMYSSSSAAHSLRATVLLRATPSPTFPSGTEPTGTPIKPGARIGQMWPFLGSPHRLHLYSGHGRLYADDRQAGCACCCCCGRASGCVCGCEGKCERKRCSGGCCCCAKLYGAWAEP